MSKEMKLKGKYSQFDIFCFLAEEFLLFKTTLTGSLFSCANNPAAHYQICLC